MFHLICLSAALVFNTFTWTAQAAVNENPLSAHISIRPDPVHAGANLEVLIQMQLAPKHHAYLEQFRLKLASGQHGKLSQFQVTPIVSFFDPISKKEKQGVENIAEMNAVFEVPEEFSSGSQKLSLELTYQACTKEYCLFPKTIPLQIDYTVKEAPSDQISLQGRLQKQFEGSVQNDLWLALILVFFAGVLTSLTPCIFPLIPITLAVLSGGRSKNHKKRDGFFLALFYVLGIAFTYSALGVLAASSGMLFGSFLGHPAVAAALATLFFMMALSLWGYFEVQVPVTLASKFSKFKNKGSWVGCFIAGLLAGIVASPCVGPVLVSILAVVAQSGRIFLGFILLFVFALGMGQLFLWMGTFQGLAKKLPKSGPWMEGVKWVFGLLIMTLGFYYLSPVLNSKQFWFVSLGVFLAYSILIFFRPPHGVLQTHISLRLALIALTALSIFTFARVMKPVSMNTEVQAEYATLPWQTYSDQARLEAQNSGKAIVIDFYADWCVACKELEIYTFSQKEVQDLQSQFVFLKFDATKDSPEFEKLRTQYQILGLPHLVFYDSAGKHRTDLTLTGFEAAKPFSERMKKALTPTN